MKLVRPEPATPLAALRIAVPAMILTTAEVRHAPSLASLPAALRVVPEGLGWFVRLVPITPAVATLAQAACVFAALCAIAGLRARVALVVLTGSTFYLFALSQLSGWVWHDMHLLWFSALLAASPCDEALAFDRRGQPPARDSVRYGAPLTVARLVLAGTYFFPGLHKLATSGLAWALSDNLRDTLWWKWAEHGVVPSLRIDRYPTLLHAGGLYVLAFELSFPVLVLLPRVRPWLALAGLGFHLLAGYFLLIPFVSLWATYVVLVDPVPHVRRLLRRPASALASPDVQGSATAFTPALALTSVVLLAGIVVQGVRGQMRSFPFACYPTFEWILGATMPDLRVELVSRDGTVRELAHARDAQGRRTQRQWAEIFSLVGVTAPVDRDRLRVYAERLLRREPARTLAAAATVVRFSRVERSVVPEERDAAPLPGPVLLELALAAPLTP